MSILLPVIGFILTIVVIVTIHEGGHCMMAKLLNVKVLKFSLGMGPVLAKKKIGETEYCFSLLPLGGYVKLLEENEPDPSITPEERRRAYGAQPRWKRALILAAGPGINFILAFVLYAVIGSVGTPDIEAVLGTPPASTQAYEAGIREGDRLVEIEGEPVRGFTDAAMQLITRAGEEEIRLTFERSGEEVVRYFSLAGKSLDSLQKKPGYVYLGLIPLMKDPVVGDVTPESPAEKAGLRRGDRIFSVNGEAVEYAGDAVRVIASSKGDVSLVVADFRSPENKRTVSVSPQIEEGRPKIGISIAALPRIVNVRLNPFEAAEAGYLKVVQITRLQVKGMSEMATGESSTKNLGGPIAIAGMAGDAVSRGILPLLEFMALISVAIGFMNLLPIPVLDGGQLFVLGLEGLRRKDFSPRTKDLFNRAGLFIILLIFVFAMNNDLARLFS